MTTYIEAEARRRGVDLATITGTGAGGRVTLKDVRAAAGTRSASPRAEAGPTPVHSEVITRPSLWDSSKSVQVDLYATNPLVDDARQAIPTTYQLAVSEGPAPTLFAAGDLPVFITSGADPKILLNLPWQARHGAAAASPAELSSLLEDYVGSGAYMAELDFGADPANKDYEARVSNWLRGNGTPQR